MSRFSSKAAMFERIAREKYGDALGRLREEQPESWFQHLQNDSIIPQLSKIGFDIHLSRTLFQIALPSWQSMGPGVVKCLWINPRLTQDLNKVREATIRLAEKKRETEAVLTSMDSHAIYDLVKESMELENLTSLLDDVFISWIILPRAYTLLKEGEGCCLITYLKYLKREKNPDFKKLIARIITEFTANFSLKFASLEQPRLDVAAAIFYGYAAMFWRNLVHPPEKQPGIHLNFLNWARAFQNRGDLLTGDMAASVREMTAAEKTSVFASS